jgi:hypothetical protein
MFDFDLFCFFQKVYGDENVGLPVGMGGKDYSQQQQQRQTPSIPPSSDNLDGSAPPPQRSPFTHPNIMMQPAVVQPQAAHHNGKEIPKSPKVNFCCSKKS